MEDLNSAISTIAIYFDETSNKNMSYLELCVSYVDKNWKFQTRHLKLFDVSHKGDTKGLSVKDRISEWLKGKALLHKVTWLCTDGASAVCAYPGRGTQNSACALLKKERASDPCGLVMADWWCNPHRGNLSMTLCNKLPIMKNCLLPFLSDLSGILNNSIHNQTAVKDDHDKLKDLLAKLNSATREQKARDSTNKTDDDFDQMTFVVSQMVQYFEEKDLEEAASDSAVEEVKQLATDTIAAVGKRTTVPTFLKIRWVSLFKSVEATVALMVHLRRVVDKIVEQQPKKKTTTKQKPTSASSSVPSGSGGVEAADVAADIDDGEGEEEKLARAVRVKNGLKNYEYMLCFLHDFGVMYKAFNVPSQEIKRPHIQEAYFPLLKLQQKLFTTFYDIKPLHVVEEEATEEEPTLEETPSLHAPRVSGRMRKVSARAANEREAQSSKYCCKAHDKDDGELIACCSQGLCQSKDTMLMEDKLVWFHRDCAGLDDEEE